MRDSGHRPDCRGRRLAPAARTGVRGSSPANNMVSVDGGQVYVEEHGDPAAPAVLYLSCGPGMSCYEFLRWQGEALAGKLRLVGIDPRGVLRSDPLRADEALTEQTLVDDCEAIRQALGIDRWSVLGHSFGGRIGLRYAVAHPDRVVAALFENPGWDFHTTERHRLPRLAALLDELGDPDAAERCRVLLPKVDEFVSWDPMVEFLDKTWRRADVRSPEALERLLATRRDAFSAELNARGDTHRDRLLRDGWPGSLLPLLARLSCPSLLMYGRHDLVTAPEFVDAFRHDVRHGQVRCFEHSAHYVQVEEPDAYATVVTDFVLAAATS